MLLAFLFLLPLTGSQPRTDPVAWRELVSAFAARGVAVCDRGHVLLIGVSRAMASPFASVLR